MREFQQNPFQQKNIASKEATEKLCIDFFLYQRDMKQKNCLFLLELLAGQQVEVGED